uniref:Uncharacterized protein n=1 Tax=Arundo donax TaxID=35708 RepID=A0A0A8Z651_ARUDO
MSKMKITEASRLEHA